MNFPNPFIFPGFDSYKSSLLPFGAFNSGNYQPFSFPHYSWFDENCFYQNRAQFASYTGQHSATLRAGYLEHLYRSREQNLPEIKVQKIQGHINQFPLQQISLGHPQNCIVQVSKAQGGPDNCSDRQQNQKISEFTQEKCSNEENRERELTQNLQELEEKKQLQNLRYQRKNIEANIVNKIYTYLKTYLKLGESGSSIRFENREKALVYYKVLEKLEKAKKQNIKREFLKGLISMRSCLPGYNKIAKELAKKGESVEQFEYNIRVVMRNYLRGEAVGSILTSKKMNPQLWRDHIAKIREIEEYLFDQGEKQNQA